MKVDKEDKLRPHCPSCGWIYYKNPIPAAACVILNSRNEIVVIKRAVEPNKGEWALPSGYIEIDQSPEQAASVEMKEETGLQGKVTKFLGYFDDSSPIYEKVISFGFLMEPTGGLLQAGDDAAEARYVHLNDIPPLAFSSHEYFVELVRKSV